MDTRSAYLQRNTISLRLQRRVAAVATVGVAGAVAAFALLMPAAQERAPDAGPQAAPLVAGGFVGYNKAAAAQPRRIYPFSIVPGGVASRDDLVHMVRTDHVVAEHYLGFDTTRARVETVEAARAVYVSYRKADKVYWTAHKVTLKAGETVLNDGHSLIRGRCGNRISDTPQLPVEKHGPTAKELDSSVEDNVLDTSDAAAVGNPSGSSYPVMTYPTGTGTSSGGGAQQASQITPPAYFPSSSYSGPTGAGGTPTGTTPAGTTEPVSTGTGSGTETPATPVTAVDTPVTSTPTAPTTPTVPSTPDTPTTPTTPTTPDTPVIVDTGTTPPTDTTPTVPPTLPWPPQLPPTTVTTPTTPEAPVPAPGTLWLSGIALAALLLGRRRKAR